MKLPPKRTPEEINEIIKQANKVYQQPEPRPLITEIYDWEELSTEEQITILKNTLEWVLEQLNRKAV